MSKEHFKSEILFNQPDINIDKENGLIKNVVIIQEGVCKNGDFIDSTFLNDLTDLATAQKNGVKSRFGHPNMCKSSMGSFIGRFKNYQVINEDEKYKVIADLHLDPITKKSQVEGQGISMYEYLLEMAENNSDMFGTSIHFTAKGKVHKMEDGKEVNKPKILSYIASDVVDHPAGTDSLFKDSDDVGIMVTKFLDENPQIFEVVKNDNSIIDNFINKYENYFKQKSKMNLLEKLKAKMQGKKDVNLTLAEGKIVTVITEAESPAVGDDIVDENGQALKDGEYVDKDGNTIVVADGSITEIKEPEGEEQEEEEQEEETSSNEALKASQENTKAIEMIAETLGEMKTTLNALQKTVKSKPFTPPQAQGRKNIKQEGEDSFASIIESQREARNKN